MSYRARRHPMSKQEQDSSEQGDLQVRRRTLKGLAGVALAAATFGTIGHAVDTSPTIKLAKAQERAAQADAQERAANLEAAERKLDALEARGASTEQGGVATGEFTAAGVDQPAETIDGSPAIPPETMYGQPESVPEHPQNPRQ